MEMRTGICKIYIYKFLAFICLNHRFPKWGPQNLTFHTIGQRFDVSEVLVLYILFFPSSLLLFTLLAGKQSETVPWWVSGLHLEMVPTSRYNSCSQLHIQWPSSINGWVKCRENTLTFLVLNLVKVYRNQGNQGNQSISERVSWL